MAGIIFDLDGTIADSFDHVAAFMAKQAGIKHLNPIEKNLLRGMSMVGMARRLGFHWWHGPMLLHKGRREMSKNMHLFKSFPGIPDLIKKLHAEGHELFVLSSNSKKNIKYFLKHQKLEKYFVDYYGGIGVFSKTPALRRLLKDHEIDVKDAVYIGDEVRDIEAARAIGLRIIAVSWGFASRDNLVAAKPMQVIDSSDELIDILEEI